MPAGDCASNICRYFFEKIKIYAKIYPIIYLSATKPQFKLLNKLNKKFFDNRRQYLL